MSHHVELIIALVAPFLVLTVLRINAAMIFLSLCLGYVLVELVAKDANSLISFLAPHAGSISESTWRLVLLLAPVVLTAVLMLFSIRERWKVIFNVFPAAATSVLLLLLTVPLLTPGLRYALQADSVWRQVNRSQALVVGIGAFISLVFLWMQRHAMRGEKK